jgi:CRISPR-associated exonuclease Cas4
VYKEEDLLPISLLQHLLFCVRRAALVQIEGIWADNLFTVEGSHLHKKVDDEIPIESRGDVRISRGFYCVRLSWAFPAKPMWWNFTG